MIQIKRVYDDPAAADGIRVLVDRLWPRGVTRARADLDEWLRDAAPSPDLRTWWNHDPERVDEFADRYRAELDADPAAVAAVVRLRSLIAQNTSAGTATTLVYGARDPFVNHARILVEYLEVSPSDRQKHDRTATDEHTATGILPDRTPPTA